MNLGDLRRLAIRKNLRIRFQLARGWECVVNEHGVAQVPALKSVPDFNLEQELAAVPKFLLEAVAGSGKNRPVKSQLLTREELAAMATASPSAAVAAHEEE
jgi:hypothetical protein